jgi:hypothetical protein
MSTFDIWFGEETASSRDPSELNARGAWLTLKIETVSISETSGNALYTDVEEPPPRNVIHIKTYEIRFLFHTGM